MSEASPDFGLKLAVDNSQDQGEISGNAYVGGGNGGGNVSGHPTREEMNAKIEASRAQNDARFAEVLSEIRLLSENSISWKGVWGAAAATTIAVGGLVIGILAIGGDRFDGGLAAGVVLEEARQNSANISRLVEIGEKRDEQIQSLTDALLRSTETAE